jgi:hypothetical protein
MTTTAYPLHWPEGWPRTPYEKRVIGRFNKKERRQVTDTYSYNSSQQLTVADAVQRVLAEFALFSRTGQPWRINPDDVIISTNVAVRNDGLPRSGQKAPADPGVAVYWRETVRKQVVQRVMAIDQYTTVADNLAAIAATLDAMRAIERHGGAQILDRAFTGFTALPSPSAARSWREVLGVSAAERSLDVVRRHYRLAASVHHPDKGGSHAMMAELNAALVAAEKELL